MLKSTGCGGIIKANEKISNYYDLVIAACCDRRIILSAFGVFGRSDDGGFPDPGVFQRPVLVLESLSQRRFFGYRIVKSKLK